MNVSENKSSDRKLKLPLTPIASTALHVQYPFRASCGHLPHKSARHDSDTFLDDFAVNDVETGDIGAAAIFYMDVRNFELVKLYTMRYFLHLGIHENAFTIWAEYINTSELKNFF